MAGCPAPAGSSHVVEDQAARLGDECDVLAVSTEGELLAIEVKPHTAADKDIAWSVLQAGMYADLFQRWADQAGGKAHEVVHGMAAQRKRIGLSSGAGIQLAAPIKVRPVVAVDQRAKNSAKEKLAEVRGHLAAASLATNLDVRQVNLIGRLDPLA